MTRVKKGAGNKHASHTAHPDCHRRNSFGAGEAKGMLAHTPALGKQRQEGQ